MKSAKPVDLAGEIAAVEKRRVMLALELQRINREREVLRQRLIGTGAAGFLSTDGADLLGPGDVHDEVERAASRLIGEGLLTRADIENAREGSQGDNA